jgi:DNA replication protein DnaC
MNNFQVAKNFAQSFDVMKKRGSNMLMLGNVGNGKTHLAIALVYDVIKKFGVKAKIITAYNLIYAINETYSSSNHKTERQVKREFLDYELLVIDEFDLNRGTNSDQLQLFDVINERYEEMLPTVVISNLSYEELEIRAGRRILSRLLDNGFLLKFTGRDRRKFKAVSGGLS